MALTKVEYVDGVTVIYGQNLNDIQDAIIALENGGGGSSAFVVTYTAAGVGTATCDKTYSQIMAALQAKQEILAFYIANSTVAAQLTTVAIDPNNADILFTNAQNGGVTTLRHNSAGTITVSSNDGYVFRDQGVAHAGKFLVVGNDGNVTTKVQTEEVTVSTAGAVSQALDAGKIYHFTGAVSSLSLSLNSPSSGQLAQYHFDFESGSTPATVTLAGVTWPDGSFSPEASKRYEVDILNGYGVYLSW